MGMSCDMQNQYFVPPKRLPTAVIGFSQVAKSEGGLYRSTVDGKHSWNSRPPPTWNSHKQWGAGVTTKWVGNK